MYLLDTKLHCFEQDIDMPQDNDFFTINDANCIILFNHMGSSGSYYLEQLLDGHDHFLFLPYINTLESFYENRIQFLSGTELLIELTAHLLGYLHSSMEAEKFVRYKLSKYCVGPDGEFIPDVLIEPEQFIYWLRIGLQGKDKIHSYAELLKLYFTAYSNALGRRKKKDIENYWIFYHMHVINYDVRTMYQNLNPEEFRRIENLILIREPVQQLFSTLQRVVVHEKNKRGLPGILPVLKCDIGEMLKRKEGFDNVRAVRFEDVKRNHKATMKALCSWLKVPYMDTLQDTTLNGHKVYWPIYTKEGKKYITGNDLTSTSTSDFSSLMSDWDIVRFNIFFSEFKRAYHYETSYPSFKEFSLEFLKELLKEPFKIEGMIQELAKELDWDEYSDGSFIRNLFLDTLLHEAMTYDIQTKWYHCIAKDGTEKV